MKFLDYSALYAQLPEALQPWAERLPAQIEQGLDVARYGDIPRWLAALEQLPDIKPSSIDLASNCVRVGIEADADKTTRQQLHDALQGLHPWRKGPFSIAGVDIDTEWRSDKKWQRLRSAIEPLHDRLVLDVGCGSGYHCWRMLGDDARLVLGIDPTPLFVLQFWALQKYLQQPGAWVLPLGIEALPEKLEAFDTVFSMGILYHRRSPMDHLLELRQALRPGGQLVLETLVVEGNDGEVLVPEGRYSKMGNVWFIPTPATLLGWLRKLRFSDPRLVDVSVTTPEEQRSTDWMRFQSLPDFLDPQDMTKTVEGYPAPRRAIVVATA